MLIQVHVPAFEISMGGVLQPELRDSTVRISVNEKIGGEPSQLTLEIADKFDASTQEFDWLEILLSKEGPLFNKDKKLDIRIGYVGHLKEIISASLKRITTSGFLSNITTLTLEGFDASHKLLTSKSTGSVQDSLNILRGDTYSDIAKILVKKSDLKRRVDKTSEV